MTLTRYWKYLALGLLAFAVFVPAASARPVVVFRGYFGSTWYGPAYYGPAYYGWYGPGFVVPYDVPAPNVGKVKIETRVRDAAVIVDGGYAGTVAQLKTFPLKSGTHDIALRDPSGNTFYQERVDVIAGKTIKLFA